MAVENKKPRNPGPTRSFSLYRLGVRVLPHWLQYSMSSIGATIAYCRMHEQRNHSRAYLETLLGRPPTRREVWKHFQVFSFYLLAKVRASVGKPVDLICEGSDRERTGILFEDAPMLVGTFHVGASDLLGFHVASTGRHVRMIRMQVENSENLDALVRSFGETVRFIWVNDPHELLLSLREALESADTVAMQCDRMEGEGQCEAFEFLGKQRLFRTSIYRLAWLFKRKIIFCLAIKEKGIDRFRISASQSFDGRDLDKEAHREAAHVHFQGVLTWLESLLKNNPYLWFNFLPLNPPVPQEGNKDAS